MALVSAKREVLVMQYAQSKDDVICPSCHKLLRHDRGFCPLFPEVEPPKDWGEPGKKWSACVCLVHTCYDIDNLSSILQEVDSEPANT